MGGRRNRGAIGTRVTVTAGPLKQMRELHAGGSHNSSNDPRLLFGLGTATGVQRIEIRWPGGRTQSLEGLPIDRYHVLRQPENPGGA